MGHVRSASTALAAVAALTLLLPASLGAGGSPGTGISFSIAQNGSPALQGALFGVSTTTGSGLLKPVALGGNVIARGGLITHTDSRGPLRLGLKVTGGRESVQPGVRTLTLGVKVTSSNDSGCPLDKRGLVIVSDAVNGSDQIHIGVCAHPHAYTNGVDGTVRVRIGRAALPNPARTRAIARVQAILKKNAARCELRVLGVSARKIAGGWRVSARVTTFGNNGTAQWNIVGSRVAPAEPLAADIQNGCP